MGQTTPIEALQSIFEKVKEHKMETDMLTMNES